MNHNPDLEYFKNKYESALKEQAKTKAKHEEQKNKLIEKLEIQKELEEEEERLRKFTCIQRSDIEKLKLAQANLERLKMQMEDHLSSEKEIENSISSRTRDRGQQEENLIERKSVTLSFIFSFSVVVLSYFAFAKFGHSP